ncbi:MAG TPA: aminoglycoside phosphotransferase family protein [Ktedonobacteraceae bacterium]|nr:aminoglycoside phosphotransferase family protein [Ktedonobacteraceae bacterium]
MQDHPNNLLVSVQNIQEMLKKIFARSPIAVERVTEGISTLIYRILFPHEIFYLRILPEEGASFAPEVAVHTRLRSMQMHVPEVIHFEHSNELLQRSVMITTEIKGRPLSQSSTLSKAQMEEIVREAGKDLARLNTVRVEGFGWVQRDSPTLQPLRAAWSTHRAFALEYWEADVAYLAKHVLQYSEAPLLERALSRYDSWLDCEQGYLAHGDFDTTHIYQDQGRYTGIIDFGEIRGASSWYDLGHFHVHDGELLPFHLLPALMRGYQGVAPLSPDHEQHARFAGLLINMRALVRSLQKRPPNRYTSHQLKAFREDLFFLV